MGKTFNFAEPDETFTPLSESTIRDILQEDDPVNPNHYKDNCFGMELINVIAMTLTKEQFEGYLRGNAIKYRGRAGNKSDKITEDIQKALWYERKLKEL